MFRAPLRLGVGLGATVLAAAALAGTAIPQALADTPPYTDPASSGTLTLCANSTTPLSSGSVGDKPFVGLAISSGAAPSQYQGTGMKATLYAYVPRQGVDPTQWSGQILTASSTYTDVAHPTAVGTKADIPLSDVITALPPQWSGYYQLRLIYSAPNRAPDVSTYGTADIQVSGSTWHQLGGGGLPCSDGKATSAEAGVPGLITPTPTFIPTYINGRPNPAAFPHGVPTGPLATFHDPDDATPTPAASGGSAAPSGATAGLSSSATGAPASGAAGSPGSTDSPPPAANADQRQRTSSSVTAVALGVLIGLAIAGLLVFGFLRFRANRGTPGSHH